MAAEDRNELAEDRTDLAEDRTMLANERTFAGWMRTGLAAVGIGLGFHALFRAMDPAWVPKGIATVILVIGTFIFIAAERRACAIVTRLKTHEVETIKTINLKLIAWVLVAATFALIAAIWVLAPA